MTRSTPTPLRAPTLVLLILTLAFAGCGGGGDAATPATIPAATDGPASSDVTGAAAAAAARTEAAAPDATSAPASPTALAPTTAVTATTIPSTTVRPASVSAAPASSESSASTATTTGATGTTGTTTRSVPSGQPRGQRLDGTVMASPTCPVERPDQPCPPSPVAGARIEVFDRGEHLVTTVDTDSGGRFVLFLPPGPYVLTASSGTVFPSCPRTTVDLSPAGDLRADILCDSGLR